MKEPFLVFATRRERRVGARTLVHLPPSFIGMPMASFGHNPTVFWSIRQQRYD
jgi:hypothetical protein